MVGNRRPRSISPFRAPENPVAAAGGGAAAGTGHAGAAGGGPNGAGNPARLRRHFAAGQPLLRLERGGTAGTAAGAAVAPGSVAGLPRTGPDVGGESRGNPVRGRGRGIASGAGAARRVDQAKLSLQPPAMAARPFHNFRFKLANILLL